MNKKRILLITNYKPGTGISVQVKLLQDKLRSEDFIADIFTTKGSLLFRILVLFKLLYKTRYYDIFHIHGCSQRGFFPIVIGVIAGKITCKKTIVTYHGGGAEQFFAKHRKLVRYFLLRSDYNIVLSKFLGNIFDKYSLPYIIIPNIVELTSDHFRKREEIAPKFISVRSLSSIYNIDLIIKAFSFVQKEIPEASLIILGDGPCRTEIEKLIKELALNNVSLKGKVDNTDIYSYLDKSDVFISASSYDNQPVSILEAFNAGIAVIASNVGGVPYIVEDNVTGYLFEDRNYNELALKMLQSIKNQEQTKIMIDCAAIEIKKYGWENIKTNLINLYNT